LAEFFLGRGRHSKVIGGVGSTLPAAPSLPASVSPAASLPKKPGSGANGASGASGGRRPDPIILLSPSASSLLRMNNVKAFLEGGVFTPSEASGSASAANILHVSRLLPSIDPARPLRFILVDTPAQFKPDYWQRVVAVFTTGQTWQFKEYKWPQAPELFKHVLGVFVGYRGEEVPPIVKNWGRGVMITFLDKWYANQSCANGRWRDREVVEGIWGAIEESMKIRGWGKEGRTGVTA
jgi:parafibromin